MINSLDKIFSGFLGAVLLSVLSVPIIFETELYRFLLWNSTNESRQSFTQYVPAQIYFDRDLKDLDVLIVGSSDMREFFPHNSELRALFESKCDKRVKVFNAASSNQSLAGSLAVFDGAKKVGLSPKVVIVGLTEGRLAADNSSPTASLEKNQLVLPPSIHLLEGLNAIDYLSYAFSSWATALRLWAYGNDVPHITFTQTFETKPTNRHFYSFPPLNIEEKGKLLAQNSAVYIDNFSENALVSMERYNYYFSQVGVPVIFLFTPRSPLAWGDLNKLEPLRSKAINGLENPLPLVDMLFTDFLEEEDFFDSSHLLPSGRYKVWQSHIGSSLIRSACSAL